MLKIITLIKISHPDRRGLKNVHQTIKKNKPVFFDSMQPTGQVRKAEFSPQES